MTGVVDHVAIEVNDLDSHVELLTGTLGLRLIRIGRRHGTDQRIAMVGDGTGFKLELIEATGDAGGDTRGTRRRPVLVHLALRVADADEAHDELASQGLRSERAPHDLGAARARSALLSDGRGAMRVQVICYQPGSPDMQLWDMDAEGPAGDKEGSAR